jgi:Na+/H+ antiporter NhaC
MKKIFAFAPIFLFLGLFLGLSTYKNDFYSVSVPLLLLFCSMLALAQMRGVTFHKRFEVFSSGAGHVDIVLMSIIFLLAGIFSQLAKNIGAVDAVVNMGLSFLPANILVVGLFITACFISLSVGTSVGTIVALAPLAAELSEQTQISAALCLGAVLGGAMFGDNLSMVSDTTIAATRSMNCTNKEKFAVNIRWVLPSALLAVALYYFLTPEVPATNLSRDFDVFKVLPYLAVLTLSLMGLNVLVTLTLGIALTACMAIFMYHTNFMDILDVSAAGLMGMSELVLVVMLMGGMVAIISYLGGIETLINLITKYAKKSKYLVAASAFLVAIINLCTANNTVALVVAGPIVAKIKDRYNFSAAKMASLMDITSCFIQGILPYGAQILVAIKLSGLNISPFSLISHAYYSLFMGVSLLFLVLFASFSAQKNKD